MRTLAALSLVVAAFLTVRCNLDQVSIQKKKSNEVTAPGPFEKKKQCAEVGWQYYQRSRAETERVVGHKYDSIDSGPFYAFSPDRDSCLASWDSMLNGQRPDKSYYSISSGYVYDTLTGELLADYSVTKNVRGSVEQSMGTLTEDAFKSKRKQLMGFLPVP